MPRCFATLGCPELGLADVFALAAKHQLDGAELRALGGTLDLAAYFTAEFGQPARLGEALRATKLQVPALGTSWHLAGGTPAERDGFVGLLPWAEALGVRWLRVFDARAPVEEAAARAEATESIRWWRRLRAERGWRADIAVETHDIFLTADGIRRLVEASPGVAILWDAHHTWKRGREDPVSTWRAIREHVVHVHVKDSISVPSAKHPYTMVLPGDGEFPMAPLREVLRADNYTGWLSLEWERLWNPGLPPLDEALTVAAERRWW